MAKEDFYSERCMLRFHEVLTAEKKKYKELAFCTNLALNSVETKNKMCSAFGYGEGYDVQKITYDSWKMGDLDVDARFIAMAQCTNKRCGEWIKVEISGDNEREIDIDFAPIDAMKEFFNAKVIRNSVYWRMFGEQPLCLHFAKKNI